jgi:regulator of sirC expression with transglutaminase-like and TPR domain
MTIRRVIVLAFAFVSSSLYLGAQRMGGDQQHSPFSALHSPRAEGHPISGTVRDANNNPLDDVRVELTDWNGSVVNSTYTNHSGSFEFPAVAEGAYSIVATSGVQQVSERIETNSWSSFNMVSLRLPVSNKPDDGRPGNSVSVAQYKVPDKARQEFNKAHEGLEKGKREDASRHLARALELYPEYADALTLRAILELDQKQTDVAIADLDRAIKSDGSCALAYMVMGSAFNMEAKYDEAIRSLQRGESLAPNYWQAYFEMGKAYIGKGDYPAALAQLERAQTLADAEYPLIDFLRAHALLEMKQYPQAVTALQSYLQKEPQSANSEKARQMLEQAQQQVASKQ